MKNINKIKERLLQKLKPTELLKDHFLIKIIMDSNDADYVYQHFSFISNEFIDRGWPLIFSYLFRNKNNWKHWEENMNEKIQEFLNSVDDLICYSEWGKAHSFVNIEVNYINENSELITICEENFKSLTQDMTLNELEAYLVDNANSILEFNNNL